jgi:hypothetical protein
MAIDVTDFRNPVKLRDNGLKEVEGYERYVLIYETIRREYLKWEYLGMETPRNIEFQSKAVVRKIKGMGYYVTGQAVAVAVGRAKLSGKNIFKMTGRDGGHIKHICDPNDFERFYRLDEIEEKFSSYFPDLAQK